MENTPKNINSNKEKTTSKDWLEMDLKAQSGAIWTDEKSKMQKEKEYQIPKNNPCFFAPDPVKYNGKEFPVHIPIIN